MRLKPGQTHADCRKCGENLPVERFVAVKRDLYPDGSLREGWCKGCKSAYNAKRAVLKWNKDKSSNPRAGFYRNVARRYGLTAEEIDAMIIASSGLCAICDAPFRDNKREPQIDHHHRSGKVRDLLCIRCNLVVGVMENVDLARKALAYLKRHR